MGKHFTCELADHVVKQKINKARGRNSYSISLAARQCVTELLFYNVFHCDQPFEEKEVQGHPENVQKYPVQVQGVGLGKGGALSTPLLI